MPKTKQSIVDSTIVVYFKAKDLSCSDVYMTDGPLLMNFLCCVLSHVYPNLSSTTWQQNIHPVLPSHYGNAVGKMTNSKFYVYSWKLTDNLKNFFGQIYDWKVKFFQKNKITAAGQSLKDAISLVSSILLSSFLLVTASWIFAYFPRKINATQSVSFKNLYSQNYFSILSILK